MSKPDKPKGRPIIFSAPMVRAIQEDRKTMTRRVVKPQPLSTAAFAGYKTDLGYPASRGFFWAGFYANGEASSSPGYFKCPFGLPGTRLWVRETWRPKSTMGRQVLIEYRETPRPQRHQTSKEVKLDDAGAAMANRFLNKGTWCPAIHMPRWASRINLEVVTVRVEKLQDISEADAKAEGIYFTTIQGSPPLPVLTRWVAPGVPMTNINGEHDTEAPAHNSARAAFETLWNYINAKRGLSWDTNPRVWVVEFKKVEA